MPCPELPYLLEIPSLTLLAIVLNAFEAATHQTNTASLYTTSTNTHLTQQYNP